MFQKCCLSNYPQFERWCVFQMLVTKLLLWSQFTLALSVCYRIVFAIEDETVLFFVVFFSHCPATNATRMLLFSTIAHQSRNATHDFWFCFFFSFLILILGRLSYAQDVSIGRNDAAFQENCAESIGYYKVVYCFFFSSYLFRLLRF